MINGIAVIFAGGKSSRMGQDKALLPFGGYSSLAEYQHQRLSKIFKKVYISSKSNKFDFDLNLIEDCYRASSPLVALVSIFETLDIEEVFVLSVDAPFVDIDTIKKLYQDSLLKKDIVVAMTSNGIEPLCAIYKKSILPIAKEFLLEDNHKLKELLASVDTQFIEFDRENIFMNLNHPEEYQQAIKKFD